MADGTEHDRGGAAGWRALLAFARAAEAPALWLGQASTWLQLPLVAIIIFDALTRRYLRKLEIVAEYDLHLLLNSPVIQDAEWHMHTMILFCALGFAYVRHAHVRLDLFRPRFSPRGRLWIELLGGFLLLLPFLALFTWEALGFLELAWTLGESHGQTNGIGARWFIKSFVALGSGLLLLAGLAMLARLAVRLFGPPQLADSSGTAQVSDERFSAFG